MRPVTSLRPGPSPSWGFSSEASWRYLPDTGGGRSEGADDAKVQPGVVSGVVAGAGSGAVRRMGGLTTWALSSGRCVNRRPSPSARRDRPPRHSASCRRAKGPEQGRMSANPGGDGAVADLLPVQQGRLAKNGLKYEDDGRRAEVGVRNQPMTNREPERVGTLKIAPQLSSVMPSSPPSLAFRSFPFQCANSPWRGRVSIPAVSAC